MEQVVAVARELREVHGFRGGSYWDPG
jgi:hypothetical protein